MLRRPVSISTQCLPAAAQRSSIRSMATGEQRSRRVISPAETRVGWIGTGVMGQSMCARLIAAGYSVTVFNRTASKTVPLVQLGARPAESLESLAAASDVVFSIVGYPSDVRSVILGASGVLQHLAQGSSVVDMTTSEPSLAEEIWKAAAACGCSAVDAPVSGGDWGAREGTLSIFAGGDRSAVEKLAPLFNCMGRVRYMGCAGKGQQTKLGNQIAIATTMIGVAESLVFAHRAGLEAETFLEAIATGAAGSRSLDLYGDRILRRDLSPGFFVNHFVKDLGICLRECERMGLALPGLALAQQLYLSLKAHGEGHHGTQALILALERLNNLSLDAAPTRPQL